VPSGSGWLHEMKYDGYRCLLGIGGGTARIYTRSGLDWSDKFPEIVAEAAKLPVRHGSARRGIVSLDDRGATNFSALQQAISEGGRGLSLFLFDALEVNGENLAPLPNLERKARLASLLGDGLPPVILYAEHIVGKGEQLFDAICQAGGEGIISKKADAPYRGTRTKCWLKIKCIRRQEFVVIGWVESTAKGPRLSLAHPGGQRGRQAALRRQGRHRLLAADAQELHARLQKLEIKEAPAPVPRAEARGAHWVRPELVAEVAFAEFTAERVVRHASFLGLREDKPASDVVEEKVLPGSAREDRSRSATPNA
jgi:bifunctional non-homologous end joining protein LigD